MSKVWYKLIEIQNLFIKRFEKSGAEISELGMDRFNQPGWVNRVWTSSLYRRAHIDVVDARETHGLWMMHCCIFPHTHNPAPIFGFDVIAGKNKITGCFIDYSPAGDINHQMIDYFGEEVARYEWIKKRELPDWAKRIFSPHIVAAGNVQKKDELSQIGSLAHILINHYLECIGETNNTTIDTTLYQNFYCENQKKNPHTPRVMTSLGLDEESVRIFIEECLFPPINKLS